MMKLSEIASRINKSKENEDKIFISEFTSSVNLEEWDYVASCEVDSRLTSYWFSKWYCTDTYVGQKIYFFDDEPVAYSTQMSRKSQEHISWFSRENYDKVKAYVISQLKSINSDDTFVDIVDIDEDFSETYKIEFSSQLFDYHKQIATKDGISVKITDISNGQRTNDLGQYEPSLVKINYPDKKSEWLELKELDFPYNLI